FRKYLLRDAKNRNAGQRGKNAVEREQYECRCLGVDPEDQEDTCRQIRIQRRLPRSWPGRGAKGIAEAVTGGERSCDPSHLPPEAEVVVGVFESVSVAEDDPAHAQKKSDGHDPERRVSNARPGCG